MATEVLFDVHTEEFLCDAIDTPIGASVAAHDEEETDDLIVEGNIELSQPFRH
jgi:hypothetical protein